MADFFRNGLDGRWGMGMGKTVINLSKYREEKKHICSAFQNQTSPGMGMGYGSSLPMSGYYHQMGPMSQVNIWG